MCTFVYHMCKNKSDIDTYKLLKMLFTRECHYWLSPKISVNTYNLFINDKEKIKTGINFEQSDAVLVIELEDILTLREKQLYLALHCWAHFHKLNIVDVIYSIKEAIKEEYNDTKKYESIRDTVEARYKYSMEMFNILLRKLPSELALEYFAKYE